MRKRDEDNEKYENEEEKTLFVWGVWGSVNIIKLVFRDVKIIRRLPHSSFG